MGNPRSRFVLTAGSAILGVTCIPYLVNALATPPGAAFTWAVGFLPDTLGNLMFSRQAAEGGFLFGDLYTSEPHPAAFFNPLFLALGWFQAVTGMFPPLALQFLRLIAGASLIVAVNGLCHRLFHGTPERRYAFLLVMLTGGLGFLEAIIPALGLSADIRGPEITTFFSLYHQAHFTAALAVIAFMTLLFISAIERNSISHAAAAGALYLFLVSFHPYDAPVPASAGLLWIALRRRLNSTPIPWAPFLVFGLFPLPVILYDWHLVNSIQVFREFYREGLVAKPWPLLDYLGGWAFAAPFALIGAVKAYRSRESVWLFPLSWVAVTPLLMLLPTPSARRVLEGFHMFLCLLAARGIFSLSPFSSPLRRTALYAGLAVASLSPVYVMARDIYSASAMRHPSRIMARMEEGVMHIPARGGLDNLFAQSSWMHGLIFNDADRYYLPKDLLNVLASLPKEGRAGTVLSVHETGLFIPILAGWPVYTGHFGETLMFRRKNASVRAFMDPEMPDDVRRFFLADSGISFIVWEPRLERLGKWSPKGRKWLKDVHHSGPYTLYRVAPPSSLPANSSAGLRSELAYFTSISGGIMDLNDGYFESAVISFSQALAIRSGDSRAMTLARRAAQLSSMQTSR